MSGNKTLESSKNAPEAGQLKEEWLFEKKKQHEQFQEERKKIKLQEDRVRGRRPSLNVEDILDNKI